MPKQVKQAVTGYGCADKGQLGEMGPILLKLTDVPQLDDAAAIAICHLNTATYHSAWFHQVVSLEAGMV